jgi:hypothetical protein
MSHESTECNPDELLNRDGSSDPWRECMLRGDYEAAWRVSDAVQKSRLGQPCWDWPRHLQYVWNGEPLSDKRVLVRCYHGLGDTIQFIRYAPLLRSVASRVIVWAQPVLIPLLQSVRGVDQWLPLHDGTPEAEYDVDIELMELPHIFRTTLETIPNEVPYLRPPVSTGHSEAMTVPQVLRRPERHQAVFNVGVVWRSGDWDDRRSLPLERLRPWLRIPDLRLHSLQRGSGLEEWTEEFGVLSGSDDPGELARIMCELDLVISVDSMPAHLAGALGVPTFTLLHSDPDWRWLRDRSDSPWYPSMRLFRQSRAGDWDAVIERVGLELAMRRRFLARRA